MDSGSAGVSVAAVSRFELESTQRKEAKRKAKKEEEGFKRTVIATRHLRGMNLHVAQFSLGARALVSELPLPPDEQMKARALYVFDRLSLEEQIKALKAPISAGHLMPPDA